MQFTNGMDKPNVPSNTAIDEAVPVGRGRDRNDI